MPQIPMYAGLAWYLVVGGMRLRAGDSTPAAPAPAAESRVPGNQPAY